MDSHQKHIHWSKSFWRLNRSFKYRLCKMKPFISKFDLSPAVQRWFRLQFVWWNSLRCRSIQFLKMGSVLKRLFSFLWWISSPYSATYQIHDLWKDWMGLLLLVAYLLIGYDLPASFISTLQYWTNRTEIVTVCRMFLGLVFSFIGVNALKFF